MNAEVLLLQQNAYDVLIEPWVACKIVEFSMIL